jgi:hypothetical protein
MNPRDSSVKRAAQRLQQRRRPQMTSLTLNHFPKILVLGAIIVAGAATTSVARATGHPAGTRNAAVPDVLERYAAAHPYGTDGLETTVTDRIVDDSFRDAASPPSDKGVSSAQQVGLPFYTPKMLAAHFNREDRLYQALPPVSAASDTTVSSRFDWSDWAIGLGSGIVLILALGGGLAIGRQWRHRTQTA